MLPSPHASLGWSLSRYSAWLEDHPGERERLQLIQVRPHLPRVSTCHVRRLHVSSASTCNVSLLFLQGSLEAYVSAARARQDKTFVEEYPVLRDMLQGGLEGLSAL